MRSRLLLLRRAGARRLLRSFTQSTAVRTDLKTRPQLPFLSVTTTRTRVRHLTTERRAQLKYEIKTGVKYTGYIWIAGISLFAAYFVIVQERLERRYPTPPEWSYKTRMDLRGGNCARYEPAPGKITDWQQVAWWFETALKRLQDPKIDGKDVVDAPHDCPPGTKDVTAKSEEWRRGYYEAMMGYAKAAEYVDGWVLDKSRDIVFPPGVMIGPSNPYPKPLPAGFKGAPREEDCELRFESPDTVYLRIISTPGFTNRQKIEAGLAYASWLDYKGVTGPASIVFEDAVHLAATERPNLPAEPIDKKTWTLNEAAGAPSDNLLTALTGYATFRARQGDINSALPIFVSILKARRNLLTPEQHFQQTSISASLNSRPATSMERGAWNFFTKLFTLPPHFPSRTGSPEPCQEAALSLHIGEIMYTTSSSAREEGLGWTREAVDVAEEQLHLLPAPTSSAPLHDERPTAVARATCRECLATGLGNWSAMVRRLAREEEQAEEEAGKKKQGGSWFGGLWGAGVAKAEGDESAKSRWSAEEKVIEERQRRVQELLEDLRPPPRGILSFLQA
ncbi:hypothetical protein N0V88_003782 [Collariella sp. IMI 366227]|nr:hypothetical protein N0V88_003782 [Collariella sp. IMI 366227]